MRVLVMGFAGIVAAAARVERGVEDHTLGATQGSNGLETAFPNPVVDGSTGHAEQLSRMVERDTPPNTGFRDRRRVFQWLHRKVQPPPYSALRVPGIIDHRPMSLTRCTAITWLAIRVWTLGVAPLRCCSQEASQVQPATRAADALRANCRAPSELPSFAGSQFLGRRGQVSTRLTRNVKPSVAARWVVSYRTIAS